MACKQPPSTSWHLLLPPAFYNYLLPTSLQTSYKLSWCFSNVLTKPNPKTCDVRNGGDCGGPDFPVVEWRSFKEIARNQEVGKGVMAGGGRNHAPLEQLLDEIKFQRRKELRSFSQVRRNHCPYDVPKCRTLDSPSPTTPPTGLISLSDTFYSRSSSWSSQWSSSSSPGRLSHRQWRPFVFREEKAGLCWWQAPRDLVRSLSYYILSYWTNYKLIIHSYKSVQLFVYQDSYTQFNMFKGWWRPQRIVYGARVWMARKSGDFIITD